MAQHNKYRLLSAQAILNIRSAQASARDSPQDKGNRRGFGGLNHKTVVKHNNLPPTDQFRGLFSAPLTLSVKGAETIIYIHLCRTYHRASYFSFPVFLSYCSPHIYCKYQIQD